MKILSKSEALKKKKWLVQAIKKGLVFVYPTDTIYGIGCNATNRSAVARVRELKERVEKPFSVIAPSKKWVRENCFLTREAKTFLRNKLPGKYTMVLELKKKNVVAENVNAGRSTLGARIPKHWFTEIVKKAGTPFVTTSVNKSGEKNAQTLDELKAFAADAIIFEGVKKGKPSEIISFVEEKPKKIERN
jgi:tRNA threonylcarbamoyl adenosine modification protein (Sua5/YciO/YrdC/YwlC family)